MPVYGLRGIFSMEFYDIKSIVENAVLFDTVVSIKSSKQKMPNTALMHKFYSVARISGDIYVVKMSVDESYSPGQKNTNKKFYHVRSIKIETVSTVGIGKRHTPIMADTASTISISDLYDLVKKFDNSS